MSPRTIDDSRAPLEQVSFTLVYRPEASSRAGLRTASTTLPRNGTEDAEIAGPGTEPRSELERYLRRRARCRERWSFAGQAEVAQDTTRH